jgi:hypothetical protein
MEFGYAGGGLGKGGKVTPYTDRTMVGGGEIQTPGSILAADGAPVDPDAVYLVKTAEHMIWLYDDRGRLVGEDVWEYDESVREIIALDPAMVLTAEQSGRLLAPLIKPLPAPNPFTAAMAV